MPHKRKKKSIREANRLAPDAPPDEILRRSKKTRNLMKEEMSEFGATPKGFLRMMKGVQKAVEDIGEKYESDKGKNIAKKEKKTVKLVPFPGEKMRDFSRRVDLEFPLAKCRSSKASLKSSKKSVKQKNIEQVDDNQQKSNITKPRRGQSPDPFAHLADKPKFGEFAQAPPSLPKPARFVGDNLPRKLTLAKRAVLGFERQRVIDQYRQLIAAKQKIDNNKHE